MKLHKLNTIWKSQLCLIILSLIAFGCGEKVSESDMRNNWVGIDDGEPDYTYKEGISESLFNARNGIIYYYFFAYDYKNTSEELIFSLMRTNNVEGYAYLCSSKDVSSGVIIYNKLNRFLISLIYGKDVIGEIEMRLNGDLKSASFLKGDSILSSLLNKNFGVTDIVINKYGGNGHWNLDINNRYGYTYIIFEIDTLGISNSFRIQFYSNSKDSIIMNYLKTFTKWQPATIDGVPIQYDYQIGYIKR